MKTFKIASYNVNSVRSRLPVVLPWLEKNRPSVLCLQETKTEDTKFPAKEFEESGWNVVFRGGKGYNGVAIVSAEKADRVALGLDDGGPADEDRLIRAVFSGITVVNTYVPQGADRESPKFAYKLEWFRRLRTFFARHYKPDQMILWCGDINVAREEIDVHNPKRLLGHVDFTPEVWEAFALWTCSAGTIPASRGNIPSSTTGCPSRSRGGSGGGWITSWPRRRSRRNRLPPGSTWSRGRPRSRRTTRRSWRNSNCRLMSRCLPLVCPAAPCR